MDQAIYHVSYATLACLIALSFNAIDKRISLISASYFSLFIGLDAVITNLPNIIPACVLWHGDWNWSGKLYSLIWSILALRVFGLSAVSAGLTFRQRNIRASLITLAISVPWGLSLGWLFNPSRSLETLIFQATMPGIAEEIALRGIAPALLLGLFRQHDPSDKMPWIAILISAIMFGCWHALGYANGSFSFEIMAFAFTTIGSIPLGWLRFKSGSVLFPILVHGTATVAFHLAPMLKS
ncbi:CPBP family intramembrane metalloprotease [Burkholderiaceae bacterium DAT-1]|nr:CPBP family intramembrane metalloprotease [Burkholderiaceae bacterium DAT-1]